MRQLHQEKLQKLTTYTMWLAQRAVYEQKSFKGTIYCFNFYRNDIIFTDK